MSLQDFGELPSALAAGLLLNLTPCVLPAIPVKIRTILRHAGGEPKRRLMAALAFLAGTLALFLPLGGLTALLHWNWGTLFQSSGVVTAMVLVLMAFAAMTWFDIPLPVPSLAPHTDGHRYAEAFVSGLLSAVLAAPCAGPFLGGVLVFAVSRPVPVILLAFTLIGAGLALPYVVLLLRPHWLRRLPRGGRWLDSVRQCLAWVLVAAAIFFSASLVPAVAYRSLWWVWLALVVIWSVRLLARPRLAGRLLVLMATSMALALALTIAPLNRGTAQEAITWVPYAEKTMHRIEALHQPYLVEFTADWCINCKVLEKTVYASPKVAAAIGAAGMVAVRADLTRSNRSGEALMSRLGGHALPFAVVVDDAGGVVRRFSGLFTEEQLIAVVALSRRAVPERVGGARL